MSRHMSASLCFLVCDGIPIASSPSNFYVVILLIRQCSWCLVPARCRMLGGGGGVVARDPLRGVKANECSIERYGLLVRQW